MKAHSMATRMDSDITVIIIDLVYCSSVGVLMSFKRPTREVTAPEK